MSETVACSSCQAQTHKQHRHKETGNFHCHKCARAINDASYPRFPILSLILAEEDAQRIAAVIFERAGIDARDDQSLDRFIRFLESDGTLRQVINNASKVCSNPNFRPW